MAWHALQRHGRVDELFHPRVVPVQIGQLPAELQGVLQRDVQCPRPRRHQLGHHIHLGIGHVQGASHVPDGGAGRHGAEGDDLCHMVVSVLAADVVHHLAPACVAEVHVDIGHGYPLRVEKPLKVQVVLHGVDIRDLQTVGHHGACGGTAPRPYRDVHALGVAHEVGHDEEVVGEPHLFDHVQLVIQLLPVVRPAAAVPLGEPLVAQLPQIGGRIVALRQLELRQVVLAEGKLQLAHIRNALGVGHRVGIPRKQRLHLLCGAQIEVPRLIAHPVGVVHGLARLDAQQHVVALGILFPQIVGIVGTHQRDARLAVDAQQLPVHLGLVGDAVVLQLQIEAVLPEDVPHGQGIFLRPVIVAVHQPAGYLSGQTRRQGDQPLGMLAQQIHIDAGLDVKALGERLAHHIGQVPIARLVFAQQHQMP